MPFCVFLLFEFDKMQIPLGRIYRNVFFIKVSLATRSLCFCALTSVGALFILYVSFGGKENEKTSRTNPCNTHTPVYGCL